MQIHILIISSINGTKIYSPNNITNILFRVIICISFGMQEMKNHSSIKSK